MIIYKTVNVVNDKFYVGKDRYDNPEYLGSGLILRQAIRKYGRHSFRKEIVEHCQDDVELNEREVYWIDKLRPPYNIAAGGTGGSTMKHASESSRKEWRRKLSVAGKGKHISDEVKEKMSRAKRGKVFSEEHKANLSMARAGKPSWNKGKKTPPEVVAKILIDVECPHCGKVGQRPAMGRWHFDKCREKEGYRWNRAQLL